MTTNAFIQSLISARKWSWIGLEKVNGDWVWPDGTKASFTNWFPGQPSGDGNYVSMFADNTGSARWNDLSSSHKRKAVCQYGSNDAGYIKVFAHNTAGGLFSSRHDALSKNPDNPKANLFSILDKLENYRGVDGNFQFKLCYPEVGKCNEWIQSSNPATETTIRGFRAISLNFTRNGAGGSWVGLGKSSSISYSETLIDDSPAAKNWHTAIGSCAYWPRKPQIPGPTPANTGFPSGISEVVLYVFK